MMIVGVLLTAILAAIAAVHVYWAAGGLWPGRTERELIDTVVGDPRLAHMPPAWLTALVAFLLAGLALWPLILAPLAVRIVGLETTRWATLAAATVFLLRGVGGYLAGWAVPHSSEPFATYDRWYYSPLCILLGLGYIGLTVGGP